MSTIEVGFRFVSYSPLTGEFTAHASRVYLYELEEELAEKVKGHICRVKKYDNYLVPVDIKQTETARVKIKEEDVTIGVNVLRANWDDGFLSQDTLIMAKNFGNKLDSFIVQRNIDPNRLPPVTQEEAKALIREIGKPPKFQIREDSITVSITNKKENDSMKNIMPNMTFGPYNNSKVGLSFYGLAVKNDTTNRWFSYKDKESYDVTDFLMQGMPNMIFAMPVSIKKIKTGDIILHNNMPMVVQSTEDSKVTAADISNSEIKEIMPAKSPFGFNFCTKLTSMFDGNMFDGDGDKDDMFGNPMMMMAMCGGMNGGNQEENPMANMMTMMMMGKMMKNIQE